MEERWREKKRGENKEKVGVRKERFSRFESGWTIIGKRICGDGKKRGFMVQSRSVE